MYVALFPSSFPPQPLKVGKIIEYATRLPLKSPSPEIILSVVEDLRRNWSVRYGGGCEWSQDHSQDSLEHQAQLEEQIKQDIEWGRVAGPFSRPPFPNKFCPQQPRVNMVFSVPKNKYNPSDPSRRMIFHFSHPKFLSKNHLTPRNDSGLDYDTFRKIITRLAQLGEGTLLFLMDVRSAYKLLNILREEWFLQVFRIGNKYYFSKVGMFGDVAAGDNWDRFKSVLMGIIRALFPDVEFFCYVDNIIALVPRPNRLANEKVAKARFKQ